MQGFDLEVIRSLGDHMLGHTDRVQCEVQLMEFELYEGACCREDLLQYMADHGFDLIDESMQCYGQEANLTFARQTMKSSS